jgi:hypothetical protein
MHTELDNDQLLHISTQVLAYMSGSGQKPYNN